MVNEKNNNSGDTASKGIMEIEIMVTEDGSSTIYNKEKNEHYHSIHGAIRESNHVFIETGLNYISQYKSHLNILEVGFGTGLNALLTIIAMNKLQNITKYNGNISSINYVALEPYSIPASIVDQLNYCQCLTEENLQGIFKTMHQLPSDVQIKISDNITFSKIEKRLQDYLPDENLKFDLVYFDAFSPVVEPDLWTEEIFKNLHSIMNTEGVLVTYCSKGVVRRTMQACNFKTERLPGPPGKHEMLRAIAV